jgi:hypothetical protein
MSGVMKLALGIVVGVILLVVIYVGLLFGAVWFATSGNGGARGIKPEKVVPSRPLK